jgi:hypothetical protein
MLVVQGAKYDGGGALAMSNTTAAYIRASLFRSNVAIVRPLDCCPLPLVMHGLCMQHQAIVAIGNTPGTLDNLVVLHT